MATILSKPGDIEMSGNISDIVVDTSESITIQISEKYGDSILNETYQPDENNRITIRLRDLLTSQLSLELPDSDVFEQIKALKEYTFTVDGTAFDTVVVLGGVDADTDPETFLKGTWLTWQPQQKSVKYNDPEWLTYHSVVSALVKVKAYFKDKDPETITLTSLPSGKSYSLNMSFGYLSGKFTGQPVYFDVWNEDAAGTQLAFVQRFVLFNDYFEHEDLFVISNSLGGLDTFRFTGKKEDINDFDIDSALFDENTIDYDVEFEKYFKKNTGYFPDDRHRIWTQEFFNSLKRYYCADTGYQSITVSKPRAKSVQADITTYNYDFEFALSRQTKYLNLGRANELPTQVVIVDPDSELFFLAPRLNEFPRAILNSQLLIPVQVPFAEEFQTTSYGAIRSNILSEVSAMGFISGDEIGNHVDLSAYALVADLHNHNNKTALDALSFEGNYLKQNGGEIWVENTAKLGGIVAADYWNKNNANLPTVNWKMADAVVNGSLQTNQFASGMIGGSGARITQDGHAELQSLILREFLRTPELIKNRVQVAGNEFWFTDPGIIQDVSGSGPYTITYKIEEGNAATHQAGDILTGFYNNGAGFERAYFDVISVNLANNQAVLNSRNGTPPRKYMVLARMGSETDNERQTSVFVDGLAGYLRVMGNVNNHTTDFNKIIAQLGYLNLHSPVFGNMEKGLYVKDHGYFENVRVSGEIHVTGGNAATTSDIAVVNAKADRAHNLANLKITEDDAVIITHREITAPYIGTLGLRVGAEIQMGENAVISWNQVRGGQDAIDAIEERKTDSWVTNIAQNTITTEFIAAMGLSVGDEIAMGANAVISWNKVTGTENVETTSGAQAKANAAENAATAVAGAAQASANQARTLTETLIANQGMAYSKTITVGGDARYFYPVVIKYGDQTKVRRIVAKRSYNDTAPHNNKYWNNSRTHFGDLIVDMRAVFGGWGGAAYSWYVDDLNQFYNTNYGGSFGGAELCGHNMMFAVFLRGGGAIYELLSDQSLELVQIFYSSSEKIYNHSNDSYDRYAPAPKDSENSSVRSAIEALIIAHRNVDGNLATTITNNTISTTTVIAEQLQVRAANIIDQLTASQISFDNATGNNVTLTGHIDAQTGSIGNYTIQAGGIVSEDYSSYIITRNGTRESRIGTSVLPSSSAIGCTAYFKSEGRGTEYAIYATAKTSGIFSAATALYVEAAHTSESSSDSAESYAIKSIGNLFLDGNLNFSSYTTLGGSNRDSPGILYPHRLKKSVYILGSIYSERYFELRSGYKNQILILVAKNDDRSIYVRGIYNSTSYKALAGGSVTVLICVHDAVYGPSHSSSNFWMIASYYDNSW